MVILLLTSADISDLSLEQAKFFLKSLKDSHPSANETDFSPLLNWEKK